MHRQSIRARVYIFYKPDSNQVLLNDFGLPLGSCASIWRNPASRPLLDCNRVLTWR